MCLGPGREEKEEEETRMTFCECHVDRRWIIRFPPSPSRIDPDALPINPLRSPDRPDVLLATKHPVLVMRLPREGERPLLRNQLRRLRNPAKKKM